MPTRQPTLTRPFRIANQLAAYLGAAQLPHLRLDAENLKRAATRQTGLTDFGNPSFEEGLQVLLESAEGDANLHPLGRLTFRQVIVEDLANRLLLEHTRRQQPELFECPFTPPLIILGLPRTGSTFLHRLLSQDPALRAPSYWELARPLPCPGKPDNRRQKAVSELGLRKRMTQDLDAKHYLTADTPEECLFMMSSSFVSLLFWVLAPVYSYLDWYLGQDQLQKYQEYRMWLAVLQSGASNTRLALKAPEHTGSFAALRQAVPEALIVQTHRDPAAVFASFVSLNRTTQGLATNALDVGHHAAANLNLLVNNAEQNVQDRKADSRGVYDVEYGSLLTDPVGTIQALYKHHGLTFTNVFRERLEQYLTENPQYKHGKHHYAAADFGYSDEEVRWRFAAYTEHFGLSAR